MLRYLATEVRVTVLAATHAAKLTMGASSTLHSHLGVGLFDKPVEQHIKHIRECAGVRQRIVQDEVVAVSEALLLGLPTLDKCSEVYKIIRNNKRPWGGAVQAWDTDPCQLGPVDDSDAEEERVDLNSFRIEPTFRYFMYDMFLTFLCVRYYVSCAVVLLIVLFIITVIVIVFVFVVVVVVVMIIN